MPTLLKHLPCRRDASPLSWHAQNRCSCQTCCIPNEYKRSCVWAHAVPAAWWCLSMYQLSEWVEVAVRCACSSSDMKPWVPAPTSKFPGKWFTLIYKSFTRWSQNWDFWFALEAMSIGPRLTPRGRKPATSLGSRTRWFRLWKQLRLAFALGMKQRLEASKMASNDSVTDLQSRIFPAMTVSCRQSKDSDDVYKVQEYPNGRLNWLSLFSCNYLAPCRSYSKTDLENKPRTNNRPRTALECMTRLWLGSPSDWFCRPCCNKTWSCRVPSLV